MVRYTRSPGKDDYGREEEMVGPDRLELSTSVLSGPRSNHLSYGPIGFDWVKTCLIGATSSIYFGQTGVNVK